MLQGNLCRAEQKRLAPSSSIKVGGRGGDLFTVPSGNQRHKSMYSCIMQSFNRMPGNHPTESN